MHAVSMPVFMALGRLEAFRVGLAMITPNGAKVHFISHQWLGFEHPDPDAVQLRRMQWAFGEILGGRGREILAPEGGLAFSDRASEQSCAVWQPIEASSAQSKLTEATFFEDVRGGYVWIDFMSIPQLTNRAEACVDQEEADVSAENQAAVCSIPAYVERCDYFWALAPAAKHADTGEACNFTTWRFRGWCRLEKWLALLSRKTVGPLFVTEAPTVAAIRRIDFQVAMQGKPELSPCAGSFTCCELGHEVQLRSGKRRKIRCDKENVHDILLEFLEAKKNLLRTNGDMMMLSLLLMAVEPAVIRGSNATH